MKGFWLLTLGLVTGCAPPPIEARTGLARRVVMATPTDPALEACRSAIGRAVARPDLGGAPGYDGHRAAILGRAEGEPMVFVQEPPPFTEPRRPKESVGHWIARMRRGTWRDKAKARKRLLRGGYLYSSDPHEAHALVRRVRLAQIFDEETIVLERGDRSHSLTRSKVHERVVYRHASGRVAKLLFGDRVAVTAEQLGPPLHRDVRQLRDTAGFDRLTIEHRGREALVASLRFGSSWVRALLPSRGAHLELRCLDAGAALRTKVAEHLKTTAPRRAAIRALQASADALVADALPFDRPRGAEDHLSDGQLRRLWEGAYERGARSFVHDENRYQVYDRHGTPHPPQTCVEMVVDTYERASGNWFQPRPAKGLKGRRGRTTGGLDFTHHGMTIRNGVMAFERFAKDHPALFQHRRLAKQERIKFRQRDAFFAYLVTHADAFRAGDIVAIRGLKADGFVHQHAILIHDTDPITGMPHALTDQMSRPRHRSWESVMAEAPLRSLLFHVRPRDRLLSKVLDTGQHLTRSSK